MYKYSIQLMRIAENKSCQLCRRVLCHRSWILAGLSCAEEQGAVFLETTRVLRVIESLGGDAHLGEGTEGRGKEKRSGLLVNSRLQHVLLGTM